MHKYKYEIDCLINDYIADMKKRNVNERLLNSFRYSLDGGKRLRSIIVYSMIENDKIPENKYIPLIPEFIHTASLIIDDLPAFDNATYRRDKDCLHKVENEGITYLVALSLINEALLILSMATTKNKLEIFKNMITNMSINGVIDGQLRSTYHLYPKENMDEMEMYDIIVKKTASFFEISLLLGYIMSNRDGGFEENINDIKKAAELLGVAYQMKDDYEDYDEDVNKQHNYIHHIGKEKAIIKMAEYKAEFHEIMIKLGIYNSVFEFIEQRYMVL